jgi:hypothetical protein
MTPMLGSERTSRARALRSPSPPPAPTRQMSVSALKDKDLMGAHSGELGDIERVVESNADKKQFLIIGGLLGSV